jgi:long-chain fatty acid transport protein
MKWKNFAATALATVVGVTSLTAPAEGIIASVKSLGMAATGVAYPLDSLCGAYNPAGNVEICDRVDVEFVWGRDWGRAKIHGNVLDSIPIVSASLGAPINGTYNAFRTKNSYDGNFGINKRLGACNEWAVGLIVYNRNFNKTTYNKPFVLLGTSHLGMEYVHETISPIIAYKWDCHNFGLSINYMVQRLKVNGLEKLDKSPDFFNPLGTVALGHVTNRGYNYSTGWGFTLGWQWHVIPCVTIGLTYQPETSMRRFKKYKGFLAHKGKLNIPAMYSAGIAWTICDCVTVAFDYQRYEWDQIQALHNKLLHNGIIELLGSKHGPGFGFRSQNFYRFGVNWQVNDCWSLRAGYRYGNTPIRRSQTVVNLLTVDTVEQFFTLGTTYAFNCCHELSGFFAYGLTHRVKGKDSIPPGIPNTLVAALLDQPFGFGGGEADLSAGKFALGVAWGWNY